MDPAQDPQRAAAESDPEVADAPAEEASIERLMDHLPQQVAAPTAPAPAGLRTARVVALRGREAQIVWRGRRRDATVTAMVDEGVHAELVARALASGDAVLVEQDPELGPIIVGVVQTRIPDELHLRARKVVIDADEEVVMRAGRGALRIREDGDVELVGSRISTLSRGLFRIVGRVLRLN
jgi:hypothetical protein